MNTPLPKVIRNRWVQEEGQAFTRASILQHDIHPEGLDVERLRFHGPGSLALDTGLGHILSVLKGCAEMACTQAKKPLHLEAGCHLYLPAESECVLQAEAGTEFIHVAAPNPAQAAGKELLLRDERFIAACAAEGQSLRWILTPQYLSRRIFLHHDVTLLSKSGNPVSWFHTTMFDTTGLPLNEEGEPVFKMSYNSRTEFNVCYDVKGDSRVRMAIHPYKMPGQAWTEWQRLDGDSTYHLNESARGPEEECYYDTATQAMKYLRNRHEVYIQNGYVGLFCMFDPAPTGSERHHPGEYSDYEPITSVLGTPAYESRQKALALYDPMMDELSLARAAGELSSHVGTPLWELYLHGREAQLAVEKQLANDCIQEGGGREAVIGTWMVGQVGQVEQV